MTEEELENTTFALFNYRYEGYLQREWLEWDRFRTLGVWLLSPHLGKGNNLKPTDLIELPIDQQRKPVADSSDNPPTFTPEELAKIEEARLRYEQTRKNR